MLKTTYGPRYTRSSKGGGSMSMRARKLGIILDSTQKVSPTSLRNLRVEADCDGQDGARKFLTALPFP